MACGVQLVGDLEGEVQVLERTLEVLSNTERELMREVQSIEREKGVQGFSETQANLEKVSEAKSAIDEEKGTMLEEISKTVTEINLAIKDRKTDLAPQIKELRTMRQQFQDQEVRRCSLVQP
jgi:intraflagellar transport protein 81